MPVSFTADPYKIGKLLGLPLPPKPVAYGMLAIIVLFPLLVLFFSLRGMQLQGFVSVFAGVVLLLYAYAAYLGYRATHLSIGREFSD